MWTALFEAIAEGFRTVRSLFGKSEPTAPTPEPVDAAAARAGTAAGAAANQASHRAGHEKS